LIGAHRVSRLLPAINIASKKKLLPLEANISSVSGRVKAHICWALSQQKVYKAVDQFTGYRNCQDKHVTLIRFHVLVVTVGLMSFLVGSDGGPDQLGQTIQLAAPEENSLSRD
jgi:hypothetical protein